MPPTSTIPIRCIERHPTRQTLVFAGIPISLSLIAYSYDPPLDISYLSLLFRGKRDVRSIQVSHAKQIAAAMGMDLGAFLDELAVRGARKFTPIPPSPAIRADAPL